jgi:RimJ/RimL family protein N-acetyltransferase
MIELQPFGPEDFQRVLEWIDTPETLALWAGATFSYPLDSEQLKCYAQRATESLPWRHIFKVVDTASEKVIGHVELSDVWPDLSARIARVIVGEKGVRGRGFGAAIVTAAVAFAVKKYRVDRVDLGVKRQNAVAIRCYEKCGFVSVGVWQKALNTPAGYIDVQWMTLFDAAKRVSGN